MTPADADGRLHVSPSVRAALTRLGIRFKVHVHPPIVSCDQGSAFVGYDPLSSVKCLAFALPGNKVALIAFSGSDRADYKKIAHVLGVPRTEMRLAPRDQVLSLLDMAPGGVTPIAVGNSVVVIDVAALDRGTVFVGSGRAEATLELSSDDLLRMADTIVADVAKTPRTSRSGASRTQQAPLIHPNHHDEPR
jgi:prolyl-tRNA editing enzyme YbaK/EbsC (Cys-tRNA(Pro) deacylase)